MVDSIKITALQDIGANIAYTTLVPVVNMAGTPTTQKTNLQNLGNLILNGAGGSYFPRAAQANLALTVVNAAQPNITSVGTLGSLNVTGNIVAGNINGGNIVVANFYYGDGGFLTNVTSGYSNSNVANYLPTFTGTVGANRISSNAASGGNIEINANGAVFKFGQGGALEFPAPPGILWAIEPNVDNEFEIKSTSNIVISTDISNSNAHFTFASDGSVYCPANAYFEGTRLNVGPGAGNISFATNPTLVITDNGSEFIQTIIINQSSNGSSDYAAYGAGSSETDGFADLGFAGHTFNDPNFTITNPGDGYVLSQGYANGIGGALVLATGEKGNVPDIVFATGGFLSNNEFGKISDANNAFELSRIGSNINLLGGGAVVLADGSYIAGGEFNAGVASASVALNAFSPDGNTVTVQAQGNTSSAVIQTYANATSTTNSWEFDVTGDLSLPGNLVYVGASPAPSITGFSSVNTMLSVTTPVAYATLVASPGARAFINNANLVATSNFGAQVEGGGSNTVPIWSDGTNWYIG